MLTTPSLAGLAAFGLLLFAAPAAVAQGAKDWAASAFNRQAEPLKPGQWVWAPEISPSGPVTVNVDLSRQLATVYRNGVRIGVSTISSGKPGHETPTGVFSILQKDANHHSSKYNNAPMLFQERLTWDGVALHAGGLPGYPESHGCVHLPYEFARQLFAITHLGGTVIVAGRAGSPTLIEDSGVLGAADASLSNEETYRWRPERMPTGPITIVVSGADERMVVMRNGVEIGRARVQLPPTDFETHVLTLTRAGSDLRWLYVGVPGHAGESGKPADPSIVARLQMPQALQDALRPQLTEGTTVLLTQASVAPHNSGKALTVMASGAGQ
ncbi:MAG: L,D-transpeptidase family protein [Phenylobacterium sp.]|nr:L,D-transpeptidase family protein [Phenylobacterium sp.]